MKSDFYKNLGLIVASSIQDSPRPITDKRKLNEIKGELRNISRVFLSGGRSLIKSDYFKITPGRDLFILSSLSGGNGVVINKSNVQLLTDWVEHGSKPLTLAAWKITYGK
ncbi:hypothetical protein AH04_284 [Erwinia phage AH04]|uniref:Uncharacterized protein n=1 Tax=Erwinia phage AH04 TaxID=2869569 RepID=A0AAE8BUY9_9CAUD|nr:hypothetical protein PQC02_gp030 [Erwinia phage AH04]QZA70757.1 hypothetical protein AH04_284 [Erwinia phage AH04]